MLCLHVIYTIDIYVYNSADIMYRYTFNSEVRGKAYRKNFWTVKYSNRITCIRILSKIIADYNTEIKPQAKPIYYHYGGKR
jgi:hypothetical protein